MKQINIFTKIVFICDLHIPYEDKKIVELILKFLDDYRPEYLILGGDIIDFYSLSKFNKDPKRALDIQKDLDKTFNFLKKLRELLPSTKIIYIKGNHESRLKKYKWSKAPELAYLRCLSYEKLFRLEELNIQWEDKRWNFGKAWFMHGDKLSKHSGDSARKNREEYGVNCITAHSHRTGKSNLTNLGGNYGAWESGCLCSLNPEYMESLPNWQQGFSVITDYKQKIFYVNNIDIVKQSFIFNNKLYTLNKLWEEEFNNDTGKTT
jgi:predicted phosphodiesterase